MTISWIIETTLISSLLLVVTSAAAASLRVSNSQAEINIFTQMLFGDLLYDIAGSRSQRGYKYSPSLIMAASN